MYATIVAFIIVGIVVFAAQIVFHKRDRPDEAPDLNRILLNTIVFAGGLTFLVHMTAG
jgi:hypothetical protein